MSRKLKIGESCVFYMGGDLNQRPAAAIVTEINNQGAATIFVFPGGGGSPFSKRNIYHHTNEILKKNPTLKTQGTWDFVGEYESRLAAALAIKQAQEAKAEKERQATEKERQKQQQQNQTPAGASA